MIHEQSSEFSIGEVVHRTGVVEGTLRMWEQRHGFPAPTRLLSGHRRYSERDVEMIRRVMAEREAGMSLSAAIERASGYVERAERSVYAALRRSRPDLAPRTLTKPVLLALTRAIEDESLSRAERPVLFGSFQHERFYRQSESRWHDLARTARLAVVFADFPRRRTPRHAPIEIPVKPDDPLMREWAIVCDADGHAACLAAWERPAPSETDRGVRQFETIWSVEPDVVRDVARIYADIAAALAPEPLAAVRGQLATRPPAAAATQLRLAAEITNRALSYLS
ncbi:MAG: MerR family transcriptional regulator [Actinomycetota bacterium]|nr:MerR family transcriptional regulator [Actinomycetota bacterium]